MLIAPTRWTRKPPLGARVDPSHSLGRRIGSSWALNEGAGKRVLDSGQFGRHGAIIGTGLSWVQGPNAFCGRGLSGFSTSSYVSIDPPRQVLGVTYPFWFAALVANTSTSTGSIVGQGSTASNGPIIHMAVNDSLTNAVSYVVRDDAGTSSSLFVLNTTACTDGLPHLFMAVSYAANDHRLYLDGQQIGTSTTAVSTITDNTLTLGALRRSSVSNAFPGRIFWFGLNVGSVADPMTLYRQLWSIYAMPSLLHAALGAPFQAAFTAPTAWLGHDSPFLRRAS